MITDLVFFNFSTTKNLLRMSNTDGRAVKIGKGKLFLEENKEIRRSGTIAISFIVCSIGKNKVRDFFILVEISSFFFVLMHLTALKY